MIKFEQNSNGRWVANGDRNYFSPERERANDEKKPFDAELSDSYSAGLALWELVTGDLVEDFRKEAQEQSEQVEKISNSLESSSVKKSTRRPNFFRESNS
jgi:hypothetical protein